MLPGKRRLLERWCRNQTTQPGTGRFSQVKQLLDEAVNNANFGGPHGPFWRSQNRNEFVGFLVPVGGGDPPEQLLIIGNASASNLIRALKGISPFGPGERFPQMPFGFDAMPPEKIAIIERWINDGCPDDSGGGPADPGAALSFAADIKSLFRPYLNHQTAYEQAAATALVR